MSKTPQQEAWTRGITLPVAKQHLTRFERKCRRLKIDPSDLSACAASAQLKAWAQRPDEDNTKNLNKFYIPEELLAMWGLRTNWQLVDNELPRVVQQEAV